MSFESKLPTLTENEFLVLKLKCQGLKYPAIAIKTGYSLEWVQLQMSTVYFKLGFEKAMHWTARVKVLEKEVCPKLPENYEDLKPIAQTTQPRPNPELLALVKYDEEQTALMAQFPRVVDGEVIRIEKQPLARRRSFLELGVLILVGICIFVAGLLVRGFFIASPKPPTVPNTAPTMPLQAPVIDVTATLGLPPTFTPKDFYDENVKVPLEDNVFVWVTTANGIRGYLCLADQPSFGIDLQLQNDSSGSVLVRYDAVGFHAQDDLGNNYSFKESGTDGNGQNCTNTPGPVEFDLPSTFPYTITAIFNGGPFPLNATYIIFTVDWLNGKKLVFHRHL